MRVLEWVSACVIMAGLLWTALPWVHTYQLESYHMPQYLHWVKEHGKAQFSRRLSVLLVMLALQIAVRFGAMLIWGRYVDSSIFLPLMAVVTVIPWFWFFLQEKKRPAKKPLVYTARIKRLLVGLGCVFVAVSAALVLLLPLRMFDSLVLASWLLVYLMPYWVALAGRMMEPIENAVKMHYYKDAQRCLQAKQGLIRIGITGSYGKTSCKVILGTILGEHFRTFITPHSYNTPMGVTRAVREMMPEDTQVFVAEMGARHVGDIREMCDLVHPMLGLITSVGPQHMETFHTIENIVATKYELIESLPEGAFCAFPAENPHCLEMYHNTSDREAVLFGIEYPSDNLNLFVHAENIALTARGCTFDLVDGAGNRVCCTSQLLGRHNIINILGCVSLALHLGMSLEEIARGIAKTPPVEHRLQLVPTNNGVTVIDDAFNASPDGTRAAMDVLDAFPGRKIIITPGLVELGDREEAENIAFGRRMADVVDIPILVAGNGEALQQGLVEGGFPQEDVIRVKSLAEASQILAQLTRAGDVVLFENDLPDHYES